MFGNMEYVYEVFKQKSFSKAANNLYISQPSLSATIKKIEEKIGFQIFDRSTNPIQLTDCGLKYIECIEKILLIQNNFESYLRDLDELRAGKITIGASNFFSSFMLPPVVSKFKQKYTKITIRLVEADTSHLEQQLAAGEIDLLIDNYPFSESIYNKKLFYSETLILAVPIKFTKETLLPFSLSVQDIEKGKHLLKETKAISLKEFESDPFVFLKTGNDTRLRAEKICQDNQITPNIVFELDQLATAYHISSQGIGITIVSDTLVKKVRYEKEMVYFKIDSNYTKRENFIYFKKQKQLTKPMEEFLKIACVQTVSL